MQQPVQPDGAAVGRRQACECVWGAKQPKRMIVSRWPAASQRCARANMHNPEAKLRYPLPFSPNKQDKLLTLGRGVAGQCHSHLCLAVQPLLLPQPSIPKHRPQRAGRPVAVLNLDLAAALAAAAVPVRSCHRAWKEAATALALAFAAFIAITFPRVE